MSQWRVTRDSKVMATYLQGSGSAQKGLGKQVVGWVVEIPEWVDLVVVVVRVAEAEVEVAVVVVQVVVMVVVVHQVLVHYVSSLWVVAPSAEASSAGRR